MSETELQRLQREALAVLQGQRLLLLGQVLANLMRVQGV